MEKGAQIERERRKKSSSFSPYHVRVPRHFFYAFFLSLGILKPAQVSIQSTAQQNESDFQIHHKIKWEWSLFCCFGKPRGREAERLEEKTTVSENILPLGFALTTNLHHIIAHTNEGFTWN